MTRSELGKPLSVATTEWIRDIEARSVWQKHFGEAPYAAFPDLVTAMTPLVPSYNDATDRISLRYTLGNEILG
jgi:hypothetical protein